MRPKLPARIHKVLGCSVFWSKVVVLLVAMMGFGPFVSTALGYTNVQGSITVDEVWTVSGSPYIVIGTVTVESTATLTIDPGVEVRFYPGTQLTVKGGLLAIGTSSDNIMFTSDQADPAPGAWWGIRFLNTGDGDEIRYAVIEYAQYGIYCDGDSHPVIQYCRITNNQYGVYNYLSTWTPNPVVNDCEIFSNVQYNYYNDNTSWNKDWSSTVLDARYNWWGSDDPSVIAQGIYDYNSDSKEAVVNWVPFLDAPGGNPVTTDLQGRTYVQGAVASDTTLTAGDYHVLRRWLVQPGKTLTIDAGATLDFAGGASLDVKGNLLVQGVEGNEVVFTSVSDTPSAGAWWGIRFLNTGDGDEIRYAVIEYAQYGIYCDGDSHPVIQYCRITNNQYGVYNYLSTWTPNPVVNDCEIFSNVQYNYYNDNTSWNKDWSSTVLDARYNWWGVEFGQAIRATIWAYEDDSKEARVDIEGFGYAFSPNGDGNKDSVHFVYDYEAPIWTVVIRDSNGQIVTTLQSQEPFQYVEWDGTDEFGQPVADGTYTAEIYAEEDGIEVFNTTAEVLLDTASPLANISSPVGGEEVFAVVPVFGDFQDSEGIYYFTVEFGEGSSPTQWTEFSSGSSLPASGYLGSWDTKPVANTVTYPDGLYTIRLTVWDFGGNMIEDTVPVNVANLYITDVSRSPSTIDISQGETADISFTISLPAEVTLKIYPEWEGTNGQLVKAVTENYAAAGSYSISWDGTDNSGSFVPDEAYIYVLDAIDPSNSSRTDSYYPTGGHSSGDANGSVDPDYDIYRNDFWNMVFNSPASRMSLLVTPAGSDPFYVFKDVPYEAGDHLIIWDGRDPEGNIITGNVHIGSYAPPTLRPNYLITRGFNPEVEGTAGNIGIKSDPYIATICYGQFFKLLYNIDADCRVTIKILPPGINSPDAPEAIEITSNELQLAGDHEVTWDAIDPLDPNDKKMLINEDGFYTFTIEATNPQTNGTRLKRGIINLYQ